MTTGPEIIFESVMLIDDNLIDLYIASRMINRCSFAKKTLQYSSAKEALNYLQENQENITLLPDVIFLDIYTPGMSGFEFLIHYEKLPAVLKQHCRVFIVSSSIDEKDVTKANKDINVLAMKEKPLTKEFLDELKINYSSSI